MVPDQIRQSLKPYICCCVKPGIEGTELFDDDRYIAWPEWIGNSIIFWGKRQSKFPYHCFVGPDWPVVIMTYFLIILFNGVVMGIISPLGWPFLLAIALSCAMLLYWYSAVIATNPGIIYRSLGDRVNSTSGADIENGNCTNSSGESDKSPVELRQWLPSDEGGEVDDVGDHDVECVHEESTPMVVQTIVSEPAVIPRDVITSNGFSEVSTNGIHFPKATQPQSISSGTKCGVCDLERPYSARHCHYCNVCVDGLEHHCPWCGKCIGEENIFAFRCFLGWLTFQFYLLAALLVYYVIATVLLKSKSK